MIVAELELVAAAHLERETATNCEDHLQSLTFLAKTLYCLQRPFCCFFAT